MELLNPSRLKRYKDIAMLLIKHGRSDLLDNAELGELGLDGIDPETRSDAEELARDLEELGPTFVKVGQMLSARADLLPMPYLDALSRLQDDVEPFSYEEVEAIVQEELGVRISKAFSEFEAEPLAAASLGQVHRAALRDGRMVAVKVQRPKIRRTIVEDLAAMGEIAEMLESRSQNAARLRLVSVTEEFRKALLAELDYQAEARNLKTLRRNLKDFPLLVIPRPVDDYTSARVLTMEFVPGMKITDVSPLARVELDGQVLAEELFRAYLKQVLIDGFFHADPHPGNVFLTPDHRLALIDLGMVGYVSSQLQDRLLKLLLAVSEGRGEDVADLSMRMGDKVEGADEGEFERRISALVAIHQEAQIEDVATGKLLLEVSAVAAETGILLPPQLALLGKTLLHLDQVARFLDPDFQPNRSIRDNAADLASQKFRGSLSPTHLLEVAAEFKELIETFPRRANRLLENLTQNGLSLKVDAIDERMLVEGIQKVANRITLGLVLAALIVGAALLMQVQTPFRIWGYPGLAILSFLAAATGGAGLVLSILWSDISRRRKV